MSQTQELNFLQQKGRAWALQVVELHKTKVPAQFQTKKDALLSSAKTIKKLIESAVGKSAALAPMDQLGFIPAVLGAGAITAGLAAITKWSLDYKKFNSELKYQKELVNSGLSPQQAANVVNAGKFNPKTLLKYAIPAIGVILIGTFLTKRVRD